MNLFLAIGMPHGLDWLWLGMIAVPFGLILWILMLVLRRLLRKP